MVLQQGKPIKVWGWAEPGAEVNVTLTQDQAVGEAAIAKAVGQGARRAPAAENRDGYSVSVEYVEANPPVLGTQVVTATAGAGGRWTVSFPPAQASFQQTWIVAESGGLTIAVEDLLVRLDDEVALDDADAEDDGLAGPDLVAQQLGGTVIGEIDHA